jgi:hypothetical protein
VPTCRDFFLPVAFSAGGDGDGNPLDAALAKSWRRE